VSEEDEDDEVKTGPAKKVAESSEEGDDEEREGLGRS